MAIKVVHAGAMRTALRLSAFVGGTVRQMRSAKVLDGVNLRTVASFIPPFSVASPPPISGSVTSNSPSLVVSDIATATPIGGQAPFTYSWSLVGGPATISNPTSASTRVQATMFNEGRTGTLNVSVTDALGNVATGFCVFELTHFPSDGGI